MFDLRDIKKCYGATCALDGLSLKIDAGERVAILGPSGAGKTTLLMVMNLTLPPKSGTLYVGGVEVDGIGAAPLRAMRRRIGTIYQQHNLVPPLRVVHNVLAGRLGSWSLARALWSLWLPQEENRARAALEEVGLADRIYSRTDVLSVGEQQRVALARVLVQEPEVVLADEPVASLDPATARAVMRLLLELAERHRQTLAVVLHDVNVALEFFPRIVGLRKGKVVFDRPTREVDEPALRDLYGDEWGRPAPSIPESPPFSAGCLPP